METQKIGSHIICYSSYKYRHGGILNEYVKSPTFSKILKNLDKPTAIVLGGDGTMLKAIKKYYKDGYVFLGINFGHKGFLLNEKDFINENTEYEEINYPLMECKIKDGNGVKKDVFVNEVNIVAKGGKMLGLGISLFKKQKLSIKGDGLVISTPLGSTGYNSSLGGPILPHNLDVLVMTFKAPWEPRGKHSIILSGNEIIKIKNQDRFLAFEAYMDSRFLYMTASEKVSINIKKSEKNISLLIAKSYKTKWDNKVLIEQGFE